MKKITFIITGLALGFCIRSFACNSSMTMDSVVYDGSYYHIYLKVCTAGGITDASTLASANTGKFGFGFYWAGGLGWIVSSPDTICPAVIAPGTSCAPRYSFGADCPPIYNPFAVDCYVEYRPTASWFTCIDSTSFCGDTMAFCFQTHWVIGYCPDSIALLGIEGGGMITNGCSSLPTIHWDSVTVHDPCMLMATGSITDNWVEVAYLPGREEIMLNLDGVALTDVEIIDMQGNLVMRTQLPPGGSDIHTLDFGFRRAGVYFVKVRNGDREAVKKFVKMD